MEDESKEYVDKIEAVDDVTAKLELIAQLDFGEKGLNTLINYGTVKVVTGMNSRKLKSNKKIKGFAKPDFKNYEIIVNCVGQTEYWMLRFRSFLNMKKNQMS